MRIFTAALGSALRGVVDVFWVVAADAPSAYPPCAYHGSSRRADKRREARIRRCLG